MHKRTVLHISSEAFSERTSTEYKRTFTCLLVEKMLSFICYKSPDRGLSETFGEDNRGNMKIKSGKEL